MAVQTEKQLTSAPQKGQRRSRGRTAEPSTLKKMDRPLLFRMYRTMALSRSLEEALIQAANSGKSVRVGHPYVGQEAVAAGVCSALRPDDYVTSGHRSHGHAIAKGVDPKRFMAELFGKVDGVCGGKAGEMAMADHAHGFMSSTEIVAGNTGLATGLALGAKMRHEDRVAVCFFGDGASNQGILHESMNLASIWKLPVLFVCDNNRYAESTPIEYSLSTSSIADRAPGYSMPGVIVDGQDVIAVYRVASELVERARQGEGPAIIDVRTYRYHGHYYGDRHQRYRTTEEFESYRSLDAIETFRNRLLQQGVASEQELSEIDVDVATITREAVSFAEASPMLGPEAVAKDVYAQGAGA